ncbi:uncharacterized protein LOC142174744 [Nicotiana tabacum]|uniref:Uncharacterized protein LOC142174744 n=1 Tax=Nicotiana tabacum TaxID=4097 RepID=A0AC58TIE4_TOBAC
MVKALQQGPWFINGYFLSVQRWEANFVASEAKPLFTAIWLELPQLSTEFYDSLILQRIGNTIGKLLKVDACTSATHRGRYARLCVEIPMNTTVKSFIFIGSHKQDICYEDEKFLCKNCGRLGHVAPQCHYTINKQGAKEPVIPTIPGEIQKQDQETNGRRLEDSLICQDKKEAYSIFYNSHSYSKCPRYTTDTLVIVIRNMKHEYEKMKS